MPTYAEASPVDSGRPTLILFTRIPVAGRAKTRLMPALPAEACAELQRALLLDQVERLASLDLPLTVCYADDGCDEAAVAAFCDAVRASAGKTSVRFTQQRGEGLGTRMAAAIDGELAAGAQGVLLMGSDLPLVTPDVVREALVAFATADVVLCPSTDGGYWCVGLRESLPALFETDGYGGPSVFERARAAVLSAGRSVAIGPVSRDLDTPDDLGWLLSLARSADARVGVRTGALLREIGAPLMGRRAAADPLGAPTEGLPMARAPDAG